MKAVFTDKIFLDDQPGIPHAVKAVDHPTGEYDATYEYDNNGNMTCRIEENQTWIQDFNEENRLEKIEKVSGSCDTPGTVSDRWTYTYNGDGVRVQQDYWNGSTTTTTLYFMGGSYEIQDSGGGGEKTLVYYNIGGSMVAMDDGTDLVYFASDNLSSASLVMDDSGTLLSENRYMPFGEVRTISGMTNISETDFGYTGQRNNTYIKLLDYKARSYSPYLNRFIQPDTIVPELTNPQALNRFAYTLNNPVKYNDPTGNFFWVVVAVVVVSGLYEVAADAIEANKEGKDYGANEGVGSFVGGGIKGLFGLAAATVCVETCTFGGFTGASTIAGTGNVLGNIAEKSIVELLNTGDLTPEESFEYFSDVPEDFAIGVFSYWGSLALTKGIFEKIMWPPANYTQEIITESGYEILTNVLDPSERILDSQVEGNQGSQGGQSEMLPSNPIGGGSGRERNHRVYAF